MARRLLLAASLVGLFLSTTVQARRASAGQATSPPAATAPSRPEVRKDPLGRDTPRQTVLGFLEAGRTNEDQLAAQYLDTPLTGPGDALLAHQLFVVLDARLPAKLTQLSDASDGSRSNPLQ